MNEIRVKEVFPIKNGLFSHIPLYFIGLTVTDFNFANDDEADLLLLSKCGNRLITPIVEMLLDDNNKLSEEALKTLGSLILSEYGDTWKHVKDALILEYNPLKNSVYTEKETTNTEGEAGETGQETSENDVSTFDTNPVNYASAGKTKNDTSNSANNKQLVERTLERTSNGTGYSGSELIQSEINMRIANRLIELVLNDVKNYIALAIY